MRNNRGFSVAELLVVIALFMFIFTAFMVFVGPACHADREDYFVKVTDKGIKPVDENTSKYLIFTELQPSGEVRVFENTDSLIEGKWNSSDVYAGITVGSTYRFKTYGWRWQFGSWYENIIDVEQYTPEKP